VTKSENIGLIIVRAISFQDFQPMWSWSTNDTDRQTDSQTDGQTDGQPDDMRLQDRALHYSASRGKNLSSHTTCASHAGSRNTRPQQRTSLATMRLLQFSNRVTLTFDLLISGSTHAEPLP